MDMFNAPDKFSSRNVEKDLFYTPSDLKNINIFTGSFDNGKKVVFIDQKSQVISQKDSQ